MNPSIRELVELLARAAFEELTRSPDGPPPSQELPVDRQAA